MSKKTLATISLTVVIIIIAGVFVLQKRQRMAVKQDQNTVTQQQQAEQQPAQDNSQQSIDTSNWKTYTNNNYGFELKYPNTWKVESAAPSDMGGKAFSVSPESSTDWKLRFTITIFNLGKPFKSENNPESWYKNNIEDPDRIPNYKGETKKININGNPAYYVKEIKDTYSNETYVISHKNLFFVLSFREKEVVKDNSGNIEKEWDYSSYLPDFEYLVNSVQFGK